MIFRNLLLYSIFIPSALLGINTGMIMETMGISNNDLVEIINKIETVSKIAEKNWSEYYYFLPDMINKYGYQEGAEIGVAFGAHSRRILDGTNIKKLWGIDPYFPNLFCNFHTQNEADIFYYWVLDKMLIFGDRYKLLRDFANKAKLQFKNESLDFIFIDGDHSYEGVRDDLNNWVSKVRTGGLVCGDDYNTIWPGVPRAVNEFISKNSYALNFACNNRVWWFIKK